MTKKEAIRYVKSLGYELDDISINDDLWFIDPDSIQSFIRVRNIRRSVKLQRAYKNAGYELDDGSWMIEMGAHYYYHLSELV